MWQKQPQTLVGSINKKTSNSNVYTGVKGGGIGGPLNFPLYVLSLAQLMMPPQYVVGPEIQY